MRNWCASVAPSKSPSVTFVLPTSIARSMRTCAIRGAMRVHLIGVAGAGMAPLAGLLRQAGHDVSGSDVAFDPPMGPRLEGWGVTTMRGCDVGHLDGLNKDDAVVVGNVCRRDHPLAVEAER